MDWKSNLRRVQSLRSVPSSCDKPTWTEAGLRDKIASVSQLVARYQTQVEASASIQEASVNDGKTKTKQELKEMTPFLLESTETHLGSLLWRNEERERARAKTGLTRSRSMGSLENSAGSIEALKALFESKAATQIKAKSSFRGVTSPNKEADSTPLMNGEAEEVKSAAEEPQTQTLGDAPVNDAKTEAKEDHMTGKVVNQTRTEKRKKIGGIDFEKIAGSQADEKRRSVADFRGSSLFQTKEKLCVSVKAMSALYLSKVAPQESTHSPLKPAQDRSSESGKTVKLTKMAEDSQQSKDDLLPPPSARHQPGQEDTSGACFQQSLPFQISKEKLHQQRQKCELRRLLKHTHPELKMLDEVVDEELAEVLSSETGVTAGETGYEGEVLSRRLLFESCALSNKVSSKYTPKMHMAAGTVDSSNVSKTSAVLEEDEERPYDESVKEIVEDEKMLGSSTEADGECEEEMVRIDVQATRRMFESQSVNTSRLNPDSKHQRNISISGDETEGIQKQKQEFEMCSKENLHSEYKNNAPAKSLDFTDQPLKQEPCFHIIGQSTDYVSAGQEEVSPSETAFEDETTDLSDPEDFGEIIKTSTALFQNNPFIPTNIEREHSFENTTKSQSPVGDSGAAQDCLTANVKNRAHLFESMPFDKIRHQNREEIETMVENIKETLNSLYHTNAIHSGGSIIEVNETMLAKKATFTLSEGGPQIKYNEVAEGGAQNFIHQLLPRANRKPQITYLKEGSKGSMEATVVNVPVHQHQFTANQDTEFKTANVVQLVEDILNQDNSLRKGVIIQEDVDRCAEIIVYSLYNYFDEKDVKSYCPPQGAEYDDPESDRGDVSKTDKDLQLRKHNIKSTISCLLEPSKDQTCQGAIRPEIPVTGNVKLFKSCIEKGDLEHLKTLQAEPAEQEQELLLNQNVAQQNMELRHEQRGDQTEENTEWVPVDVKKLKNMFSGDDRPAYPKLNVCENIAQSTNISSAHGRVKNTFTECGGQPQEEAGNSTVAPQASHIHPETQDDGGVHQAELVTVVDDSDEISNLQTAIQSLQQATIGAKSLYHSSQQTVPVQKSSKEPVVIGTAGNVKHSRTEAELPQRHEDHKEDPCPYPRWDERPSASNIASELKSDGQHNNTETCHKGSEHSSETAAQQEDEEVVFEGKLQAALDSLGRSNINVTRGDFRAAMIYRNSSKPHKESLQHVDAMSVQKPTKETFCLVTEPKSTQAPLRQDTSKEQVTAANTEHPSQSEILNKPVKSVVSEKNRRPVGPKPAIPPKPEHLKVKQIDIQSANTKKPEATQTNTLRPEERDPQSLLIDKQDHHKINTGANSGADSVDLQKNRHFDEAILMPQEIEVRPQVRASVTPLESDNTDKNISNTQQEQNMNETDESHVDFHEACKKFGGKKVMSVKNAPVKPKRVKMSQLDDRNPKHMSGDNTFSILARVAEEPSNQTPSCNNPKTCGQTADDKDEHEKEMKLETRVEMRQKKGRTETEDERRQRLSVHMDEIMRGNITAAMNIFDNLRKQEELQSILSRVEEIEQDTSEVDVKSLRGVFENVPDWVVSSDKKKQKKVKVENKGERKPLTTDSSDTKSSMAHVFGDLERASEVIMNLKEQTLTRLMDIEEAIKKALYSVSTLKSDSDIAGLSCLFKESLGSVQGSPSSGNISKISIGSSKTKSLQTQESPAALPASQGASLEVASAKQRASPPSSPAFISIQSAARKTDKTEASPPETTICPTCQHSSKGEEKYRTTKTLTCNSPAQNGKSDPRKQSAYNQLNPKRGLSVLEVQTDREGNSIIGTKTVTENYERTDNFGNQFYSSKTSTVFTAQPDTTTSTGQAVVGPTAYQVTKYPEVRLPINQKP